MQWGDYRRKLRRTLVADDIFERDGVTAIADADREWSDDMFLDAYEMAQLTLCHHTALPAVLTIADGDAKPTTGNYDTSLDTYYHAPTDMFEQLDISGLVWTENAAGAREYLDPLTRTQGISPMSGDGYWPWPGNQIRLREAPGAAKSVVMMYFATYAVPANDTDELDIPNWAYTPLGYLIAAYLLNATGVASTRINQWKARPETGGPEDNALVAHQRAFYRLYEQELARLAPQTRSSYFRSLYAGTS